MSLPWSRSVYPVLNPLQAGGDVGFVGDWEFNWEVGSGGYRRCAGKVPHLVVRRVEIVCTSGGLERQPCLGILTIPPILPEN